VGSDPSTCRYIAMHCINKIEQNLIFTTMRENEHSFPANRGRTRIDRGPYAPLDVLGQGEAHPACLCND